MNCAENSSSMFTSVCSVEAVCVWSLCLDDLIAKSVLLKSPVISVLGLSVVLNPKKFIKWVYLCMCIDLGLYYPSSGCIFYLI